MAYIRIHNGRGIEILQRKSHGGFMFLYTPPPSITMCLIQTYYYLNSTKKIKIKRYVSLVRIYEILAQVVHNDFLCFLLVRLPASFVIV